MYQLPIDFIIVQKITVNFLLKNLGKKPVTQVSVPSLAHEVKLITLSVRPVQGELRELQVKHRAQRANALPGS